MPMQPLRLTPGQDLRGALEAAVAGQACRAAFVVSGIGSLRPACIRLAGAPEPLRLDGDTEILSLSGTIAINGSHLHISVARVDGTVLGGHAAYGCIVRTTAEVLLALLPEWQFTRAPDAATGYEELVIRRIDSLGG
jgi:predicted DNA-binding protein with PD1-like motif